MINWNGIATEGQYQDELSELLIRVETKSHKTPDYAAYPDSRNNVTIGIGFNLQDPSVRNAVFAALGLVVDDPRLQNNPALNTAENSYIAALQAALAARNATSFNAILQARANDANLTAILGPLPGGVDTTVANDVLTQILPTYESLVDRWCPGIPMSNERIALVSLAYNSRINPGTGLPKTLGSKLLAAIQSGNRAAAWYEIRYDSNPSGADSAGIAKRRYYESQLFGLYHDPSNATATEALEAYQVLTSHRATILQYELAYGVDPNSNGNSVSEIAAANKDYGLLGSSQVQTLAQIFDPAATTEIEDIEGLYASVLPDVQLNDNGRSGGGSSTFNVRSTDILIASTTNQTVDAGFGSYSAADQAAAAGANHILIGIAAGDTLIGGLSNDILIAQGGNETLKAGSGADTLIASVGDDTLYLGPGSALVDFKFLGLSGFKETVIAHGAAQLGSIWVESTQIGANIVRDPTQQYFWTDGAGDSFHFIANPSNPPAGYTPDALNSKSGELVIKVGGANGNEIDVWGFNLSASENNPEGFLGLNLRKSVSMTTGSNAGVDPPAPDFAAGASQTYTVWLDTPAATDQTVTITLTGIPTDDFGVSTDHGIDALATNGTFTITIPAGQSSASFALVNTGDPGNNATLQLTASVTDPNNLNAPPVNSGAVTQNYIEPTPDPFNTGTTGTIAGHVENAGNTTYTSYTSDGADDLIAAGSGVNYILGGAGKDLITGGGGNGVIWTRNGDSHIYAGSQVDLQTAIDTETSAPAGAGQGYLLAVGDGNNTIVGGSGNELIMTGDGNNLIVAGANDTIHSGVAVTAASLNWTTWGSGSVGLFQENIRFDFSGLNWAAEGGPVPPGYEGSGEEVSGGHIVGTGNDTIFGGTGYGQFWLSNGNNYVATGAGNDEIIGGMGSNTIMGGTGNISVLGGGGSDYIAGGSGNDFLIGRGGDNTIIGGSGNDTLFAGNVPLSAESSDWTTSETGNNYIEGSSGNDYIFGAGGHDTLIGGTGNVSIFGGAGTELIIGGSGNDLLNGGSGNDTIEAGGGGRDTLIAVGSSGSTSVVYGGSGTDYIQGGLGTNVLYAGDGGVADAPTTVLAGADSSSINTLYGGTGVDVLEVDAGTNVIYAGDGGSATARTTVVAGSGTTTVYGGLGIDFIQGGSGTGVLYAGDGGTGAAPTVVIAGTGVATLFGGAGTAFLGDSVCGSDVLVAGSGDDTLVGSGADTLIAGTGNDYLNGIFGNVTYEMGANSGDVLISGLGSLVFGSGVDPTDLSVTAALSSDGALAMEIDGAGSLTILGGLSGEISGVSFADSGALSLNQLVAEDGVDQTIAAASGNLVFNVESGANITGGTGSDTLSAWGAQDTLTGGLLGTLILAEGAGDQILGGNGSDTVVAAGDGDSITAGSIGDRITATGQSDQIFGGAGNDTIVASGDHDTITAGNGNGQISVTGANASIVGSWGNDTLIAAGHDDTIVGGFIAETFVVQDSSTVINPSAGSQDTILSSVSYVLNASVSTLILTGSGNLTATDAFGYATITGNAGNDTLIGGSRSDVLVAGSGVDTLIGGSGHTLFVINNVADVIELGTGTGEVQSSVSYALAPGLDTLTLTGTANLVGTGNNDATNSITGNAGNDTLVAGSGADTLIAGSGIDTLVAGTGTDLLLGANGDTFVFSAGFGHAEASVSSGQATVQFGPGISVSDLTVGATLDPYGNPALVIKDGNSAITVDGGLAGSIGAFEFADGTHDTLAQLLTAASIDSTTIAGATGNLVFNGAAGASLVGGVGQDTLCGLGSSDTLIAGSGNQVLYGFGPNAVLAGSVGSDTLHGGVGNDTLIGGTGTTVMDGGQGNDFYMLTAGGTALIDPSDSPGTEVLYLPEGMSYSDFTAYESPDGDLILKALSGDTTAVIQGFYLSTAPQKSWILADDADLPQFLTYWLASPNQIPSGSSYSEQIEQLRRGYAAKVGTTLQRIGMTGGMITDPSHQVPTGPDYNYVFDGVTTENDSVQGGSLTLSSSQNIQYSYTTHTTVTTRTIDTPVYGTVSVPSHPMGFVPVPPGPPVAGGSTNNGSSGGPFDAQPVYDSGGTLTGYNLSLPGTVRTEQTGTIRTTETIEVNTITTEETEGFTLYNITGDGGNDVITATSPFAGTLVTGNGNVFVDLGAGQGYPDEWTGGDPHPSDMVGAFIECGNGNDTIYGTRNSAFESVGGGSWSADVIAAGTGFDYLYGSLGTTYYVPLEGYSTDVIADVGTSFQGLSGVYDPPSTVMLPSGIGPLDLKYRVFQDANSGSEILQLEYGNSDLLVYDDSSPTFFQFANGTRLSRDQLIAQATLLPNDFNPVVTAQTPNWNSGEGVAAASLFTVTDSPNDTATWFRFENSGTDGGYFVLNNQVEASGQSFMVNASQLAQLEYVAGNDASTDQIQVSAFDGAVWSAPASLTVTDAGGTATAGALPVMIGTVPAQTLSGGPGNAFVASPMGDGTFITGASHNVVAFNSYSGSDTIIGASGASNVLSLGELDVESLSFRKNSNDLILSAPTGDSLTFQNWYSGAAYHDFFALQAIDSQDYNPQGSDPLHQNIIESFNFGQLVDQFDAARQSDPGLSSWQLSAGLATAHVGGSDTQALGGDLAYYYSENRGLAGMNLSAAQAVVQDPQYGIAPQTVHPWSDVSGGAVHL